jgi:hypothetical protein
MESDWDAESLLSRRDRRDSTSTFITLLQLDPAPMDSDGETPTEKEDPMDSLATDGASVDRSVSSIKSGSTMAPGLSGSGHGAIYYRSFCPG